MTYEEAIAGLKYLISDDCTDHQFDYIDEIEMAIEAMELQVAKKPEIETCYERMNFTEYEVYVCPNCESLVAHVTDAKDDKHYQPNNCGGCGQKLDWSVE